MNEKPFRPFPVTLTSRQITSFWTKVDKTGDCWLWKGGRNVGGYGYKKLGWHHFKAHRISYFLAHGSVPETMSVCHHCDNRLCVNPAHLFLGTRTDNMRDMWEKGRQKTGTPEWREKVAAAVPRGESHRDARLTDETVRLARAMYGVGEHSMRYIARHFGVTHATMQHVLHRKTWTHIAA